MTGPDGDWQGRSAPTMVDVDQVRHAAAGRSVIFMWAELRDHGEGEWSLEIAETREGRRVVTFSDLLTGVGLGVEITAAVERLQRAGRDVVAGEWHKVDGGWDGRLS